MGSSGRAHPFFSQVPLIKKKDDTWLFCVDYIALNAVTIKDRFPIMTVEELLDEITGARIFPSRTSIRGTISPDWESHLQYLHEVFTQLQVHQLFARLSKCEFGCTTLAPLTDLLRKDAFVWTTSTTQAFKRLQEALMHTRVLQLPDFNIPFIVQTDASGTGIVSDRDPVFMSGFWRELFRLHDTLLSTSSAYHPQTDGQTEPYRQSSLARRSSVKLSRCFFGPFQVLEKLGAVAYRLALLDTVRLHNVFHVSKLKKFVGDPSAMLNPLLDEFLHWLC
ncbi:uncharacterized protein LOC120252888 [Dioscorea cayenensis subsp. rotundata]|uniref:Uncharacterized protein LOC120252888 n=1 Tax=Dioscorea cayennensis subsp. rotundata TaxID=55577 RepID=A0AB40AQ16_DIOCR|nr:uncharacterized protein LOC120252888 [Dioscorea cayenensis subsp. rotundata]